MPGFIHSSIGQEAIPCAISPFLEKDDYVLTTHRGHSDIISRGARFDKMFAELFAKETGYCKGVGGSMHIAVLDLNIPGALAIVGSGITVAAGIALASKLRNSKQVTICYFGDGACTTGAVHEGLSLAATLDLPVVYVIENNQYEESTHWTYWGGKLKNLAEKALGYGIPGVSVDGNDAVAVAKAAIEAIDRARGGGGPTLLEGVTYRIYGHHMGDPGGYRTKEEIERWKKKDPIDRLHSCLIKENVITEEENKEVEAKISQEIEEAVKYALESPEISLKDAFSDNVYYGRTVSLNKL
jgi:pyruvate dehydrogenase E1 component alpha subunit